MPRIIAYTYEADYHCPDCAKKRFPVQRRPEPQEDVISPLARDNDDNPVHPVFDTDETPPATRCGDCRAAITEPFFEQCLAGAEKAQADKRCIVIEVRGGCVVEVSNVPLGFTYRILDHDNDNDER